MKKLTNLSFLAIKSMIKHFKYFEPINVPHKTSPLSAHGFFHTAIYFIDARVDRNAMCVS